MGKPIDVHYMVYIRWKHISISFINREQSLYLLTWLP